MWWMHNIKGLHPQNVLETEFNAFLQGTAGHSFILLARAVTLCDIDRWVESLAMKSLQSCVPRYGTGILVIPTINV